MLKHYNIENKLFEKYEQAARNSFPKAFVSKENILRLANEAAVPARNFEYLSRFLDYADEELLHFIWLLYYVQFESNEDIIFDYYSIDRWHKPQAAEEKFPGGIGAAVYLLAVENLKKWVKEKGLGEDIIEGYYTRYRYFLELNGGNPGVLGMKRLNGYLYGYSKPFFLRLGRLAFEVARFEKQVECYADDNSNRIFVASAEGLFNADGDLDVKEGSPAIYEKSGNILKAQKFGSYGRLEKEVTNIDLTKFKLFLSKEDFVIKIHIPEGGRLDEGAVAESLAYARDVFGRHFPYCKAFVCHTWFIDPVLVDDGIIKKGGNMEKFADLFDKVTVNDSYNGPIFEHIFKTAFKPLTELRPENDFQKKVLERALSGKKMHWCYGVLK